MKHKLLLGVVVVSNLFVGNICTSQHNFHLQGIPARISCGKDWTFNKAGAGEEFLYSNQRPIPLQKKLVEKLVADVWKNNEKENSRATYVTITENENNTITWTFNLDNHQQKSNMCSTKLPIDEIVTSFKNDLQSFQKEQRAPSPEVKLSHINESERRLQVRRQRND